jgi:uncharacterized protein YyaL (SSP411 family)
LAVLRETYRPALVLALASGEHEAELIPLLQQREAIGGQATAYVCRRFVCRQPVTDPEALRVQLAA